MSEVGTALRVDSATGIEVTLPVAGAGARSFAFVIDWHIRAVLAFAWYASAALLYNGRLSLAPPANPDARWFGIVVVPTAVLYFLYHPLLEVLMRGSTPGKRMAGVRVVTRTGGAAGAGALLVRNVFRLIDSLPVAYGLGLMLTMLTREHVRCGDLAAGTLLIYERTGPELALPAAAAPAGVEFATAELAAELLARWAALEAQSRALLARQLLQRAGRPAEQLGALDDQALAGALRTLAHGEPQRS